MREFIIPQRRVPVRAAADVLVAGAGTGGVCAAVAAARAGADCLLVERNAYPGGVATSGLMCSITNHFLTRDGTQVTRGLAQEVTDRLVAAGGAMPDYLRPGQPQIPSDPEALKRVLIEMLREAGVRTVYAAHLSQVSMDGETVAGVVCEGKGGPYGFAAEQFVDATGDLDLFTLAGGECETRGGMSTLLFRMGGVDIDAAVDWIEAHPDSYDEAADIPTSLEDTVRNWREYGVFHLPHYAGKQIAVIARALQDGDLPETFGEHVEHLWAMGMYACRANNGTVLINSCAFHDIELDLLTRGACEDEGRLAAKALADFLVAHFPGFGGAQLIETASEIGMRLSRRMKAKHTLTAEEFRTGTRFGSCIGRMTEVDHALDPPARYALAGEIPFECLIAERPGNVVCGSGKNAATEFRGLLRGQVGCMVIGQAAGVAAAIAASDAVALTDVDVSKVRGTLVEQGADLGERRTMDADGSGD